VNLTHRRQFPCCIRTVCAFLLLIAPALAHEGFRIWTDERGRKVSAKIVTADAESVILQLEDGRKVPFALSKLSHEDRKVVSLWRPDAPAAKEQNDVALNFDAEWPTRVSFKEDPEVQTVSENAEKMEFIYESANFRYIADARLSKSVVSGFAQMFETTHLYCRELPLGLNGGVKTNGKYMIRLFEAFDSYVQAGGPPSSAGVYFGGENLILVPFSSLGVRPVGSGYMLDRDKSNKTLAHEIVHQLTPKPYFEAGAVGWFSEGIADYVAVTPYRSGSYAVSGNLRDMIEYVTAYGSKNEGSRALGADIMLPPLEKWMLQSYEDFRANSSINYGAALLITSYFFHMDRLKDGARVKKFLGALHQGKKGKEALDLLLDGDSFDALEEQIVRAYKREGVNLRFLESVQLGNASAADE
jgi:hypothetical protein